MISHVFKLVINKNCTDNQCVLFDVMNLFNTVQFCFDNGFFSITSLHRILKMIHMKGCENKLYQMCKFSCSFDLSNSCSANQNYTISQRSKSHYQTRFKSEKKVSFSIKVKNKKQKLKNKSL